MKRKLLAALILVISGFYGNIFAQHSIYVKKTYGNVVEVPLSQIKKITFSENDMVLHKTNASTLSWIMADIQKCYYGLATIDIDNPAISETNNVSVYPNPSNGLFNINYKMPKYGKINIELIDIMGRKIKTLISECKNTGEYKLEVQTQNLQGGTYLIKIQKESSLTVKKIMIVK